jgi:hypothetical protein
MIGKKAILSMLSSLSLSAGRLRPREFNLALVCRLKPVVQIQLQQNRYLWVHFAALAAVPLLLDICWAGLASAGSTFNYPSAGSLQFWAIALLGIAPTLWMQLSKPFYLFSLPPVALRPTELTEEQRRCLQLLKSLQVKIIAGITAGFSVWLLWQVYARSPQAAPLMSPTAGLVSAAVAFFFACAILQISVSAGRSLFVGPDTLKRVVPVEVSAIATEFLILGIRVNKLLPSAVYAEPSAAEPEAEPLAAEPLEKEPTEAEPTEAEPTEAEPTEAEPTEAEPIEAESEAGPL